MAYPGDWDLNRKDRFFCKTQTVIGTAVQEVAGDAFHALEMNMGEVFETSNIEDNHEGRSIPGVVEGAHGPHQIDIPMYFRPSGTAGVGPDILPLLEAFYTSSTRTAVTVASGGTDSFTTSDDGVLQAGDVIFVPLTAGNMRGVAAYVQSVSTISGVDTVTLESSVGFTIANGTVIPASIQLSPRGDIDETKFLTLAKHTPIGVFKVAGCQPNQIEYRFAAADKIQMTLTVLGRHAFGWANSTLYAGINDAVTSFYTNAACAYGVDSSHPIYITCDSETMIVTAYDRATAQATVTRGALGTTPASHLANAAVNAYCPTPSTAGDAVSGIRGAFSIQGTSYSATEMTVTHNENYTPVHPVIGQQDLQTFVADKDRETTYNITVKGQASTIPVLVYTAETQTLAVLVQGGEYSGKTIGLYSGSVFWEPVQRPAASGEIVPHTLQSRAVVSATEDGCYRLALL